MKSLFFKQTYDPVTYFSLFRRTNNTSFNKQLETTIILFNSVCSSCSDQQAKITQLEQCCKTEVLIATTCSTKKNFIIKEIYNKVIPGTQF
jgi:hypothetical protein